MDRIEKLTPMNYDEAPKCTLCGHKSYKIFRLYTLEGEKIVLNLCLDCYKELTGKNN